MSSHSYECPTCGTVRLDVGPRASDETPVSCTSCGRFLGTWGEAQDEFIRHTAGTGVFDLKNGKIMPKK